MDRIAGGGLCLEPHGSAHALGHAGHGGRPDAGRLRPVERGRVCRQHLLDRGLRPDRLLGRGGRVHALPRCEDAARDQAGRGRARRDLRALPTTAACAASLPGPSAASSSSPAPWSPCFVLAGVGMGAVKKQFFPTSDRPELLVEVQMPEGSSIEATGGAAAKVEDWLKQQPEARIVTSLYRPGRAALLLRLQPGAARPLLRQDHHPDARRRGARSAQGAVACADRRRPGTRSAPARHPARVRPLLAVPRGLPRHGARSRASCAASPIRSRR